MLASASRKSGVPLLRTENPKMYQKRAQLWYILGLWVPQSGTPLFRDRLAGASGWAQVGLRTRGLRVGVKESQSFLLTQR